MLDKLQVKESLLNRHSYLITSSLESLEENNRFIPNLIKEREKEIDELLNTIDRLKMEIDILKEIQIYRSNEIERLKNEDKKMIITINEDKKVRDIWSSKGYCYKLYIELEEVTLNNEPIRTIIYYELSFAERVSVRNNHLLSLINEYDVKEIHTNVNIDKFIKENKLNNIIVINN